MKTLITAAAVALIPTLASADALPKQVEALTAFNATWKGAGTMVMGKDKAKVELALECKPTSAKFGSLCTFAVKGIPGVAVYSETDLFGYEPNSDSYHWYSVTNAGETHDHVAKAGDLGKIQFVYTGTQEGKPMREVIDMQVAKDAITFKSETFVGGQSTAVFEGKVHK